MYTRAFRAAVAGAAIIALAQTITPASLVAAAPQPGSLDKTFGGSGKVLTDFGDQDVGYALAISGGQIVAAGYSTASGSLDFALARYNGDGSLNTNFGSGGKVLTDFSGSGSSDHLTSLVIQGNGKIVAAGYSNASGSTDFALARYNANGSLDTSFGSGGKVLTDFSGGLDQANAVAIQGDGKIVVAGASAAGGSTDFALARYNVDGSLDTSFGSGGKVLTDFSSSYFDTAYAVVIQGDGKIVAAGASNASSVSDDFALARYNANGILDTSFGSGGKVLTDFSGSGSDDAVAALAIQGNGRMVAAGFSDASGTSYDFALARYNANGILDTSFGSGGKVLTDLSSGNLDAAGALAIQGNGKLVAAGFSLTSSATNDFSLARYNGDGSLDTGFGSGGKVLTDFSGSGSEDAADALAIQSNGKLVVAGVSNASGSTDFALARYNP